MDPITLACAILLGGIVVVDRIAAGSAKRKDGGTTAVTNDGHPGKQVVRGDRGSGNLDSGGEAHQLPAEHLRVDPPAEPTPATSPAAPPDVTVLRVVRDKITGKFTKAAA